MIPNDHGRNKATGRPPSSNGPESLRNHDRAVSPVIGVVMLVAITVLMASAVAIGGLPFTENMGDNTPNVDFSLSQTGSGDLVLTHSGGERIETTRLSVDVAGTTVTPTYSDTALTAGGTVTIASTDVSAGQTVTLVYTLESGETAVLYRTEAP